MNMNRVLIILAIISGFTFSSMASSVKLTTNDGMDIKAEFFTPEIVRIVKTPTGYEYTDSSLSVILSPRDVKVKTASNGKETRLSSEKLTVVIDKVSGKVTFIGPKNKKLLSEKESGKFTPFSDAGVPTTSSCQIFNLDKDEIIYGLGQHQDGVLSRRNISKTLIQDNKDDVSPFFQSTKGYGLLWDNYSPTTFSDNEVETTFRSDVGPAIDYYFMYGGDADGVVACVRELTGDVPMFPLWTYGFWQSKERYKDQDETLGVVKKYRELGVPLDGIIQDWQYWGHNYLWNAMDFLTPGFYDPKRMVDDIHGLNAHVIISIWSSFGPATKPYRELDSKGLLYNISTWPTSGLDSWPPDMNYPSGVRVYDAFSPEARDIYWKYMKNGLYSVGVDGWWMDSTEPDHFNQKEEDFDNQTYLGSFRKVRNAYPLMTVGGVYTHQRAEDSDKRVFIMTRSGLIGQQRYGSNVWTGDTYSSWDDLRKQIPAGLNFSMCGMPHWNSDIGGFFASEGNDSPLFRERLVRWTQFGAFCPMMRSHGTNLPREIYMFGKKGEPIYDALEKAIRLRYMMLPYIYSTSWDVTHNRSTFMRPLVMDFPKDKKGWNINGQYMFGRSILVAPVLEAKYTPETIDQPENFDGWDKTQSRTIEEALADIDFSQPKSVELYLPHGTSWFDFWNETRHDGGQTITRQTSLDEIPLYVRSGSILPIGPDVQYAVEKPWDSLEMRVYPGSNGSFTLYEDEFDNYNYETGHYTEIPFTWDDRSRRLTIGERKGGYEGMIPVRTFTIRLAGNKKGVDVTYSGEKMVVSL